MGSIPVGTTFIFVLRLKERILSSLFFVFSQPLVNGFEIFYFLSIFDIKYQIQMKKTFTRQELYELVWSESMVQLSK